MRDPAQRGGMHPLVPAAVTSLGLGAGILALAPTPVAPDSDQSGVALRAGTAVAEVPAQPGAAEQTHTSRAAAPDAAAFAAPTGPPASQRAEGQVAPRARWQWPIRPRPAVLRPFRPPASRWGAGHRGVDLAGLEGTPVRAVAAGTVTHVGVVAGRPTVTVTHFDGLRSTYEPVRASVRSGQAVDTGQVLGVVVLDGSHCLPVACLHLGALRANEYLDPLRLLGSVRVRLLPLWR